VYADEFLLPWLRRLTKRVPGVRLVDAHTHLGGNDPDGWSCSPAELTGALTLAGAQAVVFPLMERTGYREANNAVLAAAAASEGRLVPFCRVNPCHWPAAACPPGLSGRTRHTRGAAIRPDHRTPGSAGALRPDHPPRWASRRRLPPGPHRCRRRRHSRSLVTATHGLISRMAGANVPGGPPPRPTRGSRDRRGGCVTRRRLIGNSIRGRQDSTNAADGGGRWCCRRIRAALRSLTGTVPAPGSMPPGPGPRRQPTRPR
jgi:hypothetical protein